MIGFINDSRAACSFSQLTLINVWRPKKGTVVHNVDPDQITVV